MMFCYILFKIQKHLKIAAIGYDCWFLWYQWIKLKICLDIGMKKKEDSFVLPRSTLDPSPQQAIEKWLDKVWQHPTAVVGILGVSKNLICEYLMKPKWKVFFIISSLMSTPRQAYPHIPHSPTSFPYFINLNQLLALFPIAKNALVKKYV